MTNYDCYFGTQERAIDSLSLLLEFPNHPRQEVREWQKEVKENGVQKWLKSECINQRWWHDVPYENISDKDKENILKEYAEDCLEEFQQIERFEGKITLKDVTDILQIGEDS